MSTYRPTQVKETQVQRLDAGRILFLAQFPPPINGASTVSQCAHQCLTRAGLISIPYNISASRTIADFDRHGCMKHLAYAVLIFRALWRIFFWRFDLAYLAIAHLPPAFYRDCILLTALKFRGRPVLVHFHGKGARELAVRSPWYRALFRIALHNSNCIVLSEHLRDDIRGLVNTRSITVVNNGAGDYRSPSRVPATNSVRFLFFSNLIINKGLDVFLSAVDSLSKRGYSIDAAVAGGDSYDFTVGSLASHMARQGVSGNIRLLGHIAEEEKVDLFAQYDVLVHPTRNDAFPLVILEAMSAGLAVISTHQGAIPEMIRNGMDGLLVEPRTESVADAMRSLIDDAALLETMQQNARKRYLDRFKVSDFEANFLNVVQKVLQC